MSTSETDPLLAKHPTASKQYLRDLPTIDTSQSRLSGRSRWATDQQRQQRQRAQSQKQQPYRNRRQEEPTNTHDFDPSEPQGGVDATPLSLGSFYELIGMKGPDSHGQTPRKLEAAHGLYKEICDRESKANRKFQMFDLMIMALIVMQIILSGVFIVLGSVNIDHHIVIAVLGAVGTVIAGILALVKGQGLPNRLRMERDGLRKVIFEAEELYWDVGAGRAVTFDDIRKVRAAYMAILEDARRNHPDTWNAIATAEAGALKAASSGSKNGMAQAQDRRPTALMAKI
ncbi:hypothetical protein MBLNU459_g2872t1 [Dothideomycetes sp. NU459]